MSIEALEQFAKGGPYYGPKGGKYKDSQHKIPWGKDRPDYDISTGEGQKKMYYDAHEARNAPFRGPDKKDFKLPGETGHDPIFDEKGNPTGKVKMYPTGRIVDVKTGKEVVEEKPVEKKSDYKPQKQGQVSFDFSKKSMDGISALDDFTKGGGPYYGPRGGKWQDPQHKIPWDDKAGKKKTGKKQKVAEGQLGLDFSAPAPKKTEPKPEPEKPKQAEPQTKHEKAKARKQEKIRSAIATDEGLKDVFSKMAMKHGGSFFYPYDLPNKIGIAPEDSAKFIDKLAAKGWIDVRTTIQGPKGKEPTKLYQFTSKGRETAEDHVLGKRGDKEPVKEAPKEKPKEAKPKKEKAPKASKAAPTGTKDNPLKEIPKDTKIADHSGIQFSKWDGKLAIVSGPTYYDKQHPSGNNFDPETMSHRYHVRNAIDYRTKKPIPANDKHIGLQPNIPQSDRNKPYEQIGFRVGGGPYGNTPGEEGTFDAGKEVWVQSKLKDLSPAENWEVQKHLQDKGYVDGAEYYGSGDRVSVSDWKQALTMTVAEIDSQEDYKMSNAVDNLLRNQRVDTSDNVAAEKAWAELPGIFMTGKKGGIKTIIDKKEIKKSMGENDMSGIDALNDFAKGGPYIGPKGGKWADPQHKIPWDARQDKTATKEKRKEALGKRRGDKARQEETTSVQSALKMLSGWGSHGWKSLGASMQASLKSKGLVEENKKAPGTYVLNEKGKAMAAKIKKSEGIDEIMDFAKGSLPSGEPKMGSGEEQGGKLEGKGKTGGSGDSASGPAIGAPTPGKDKFSEDDEDEKKAMKEHKKPLEQSTKSFRDTTPQGQRDAYALEHAQLVSRLKKGEEDERVSVSGAPRVEVEPEAMAKSRDWNQGSESRVTYSSASDEFTAELAKSEAFYHGGAPRMSPHIGIMHMKRCAVCGDRMSKALTACPHCGEGTTDLGVVYVEGE